MDFLLGLSALGTYMNNNDREEERKVNTTRIPRDIIIGNNIYNNSSYRYLEAYYNNLANEQHKLAERPEETGIIPNFYNQMKEVERRRKYYLLKYFEKTKNHEEYLKSLKEQQKIVEGFDGDISIVQSTHSTKTYLILFVVIVLLFVVVCIIL